MPTDLNSRVVMLVSLHFWPFAFTMTNTVDHGLDKVAKGNPKVSTKYKHLNLIWAIWVIVSKLWTEHVVEVIFEKVKGHRANLVPFNKLTHPEQLNDMMDVWAKVRVDQIFAEQMPPPPMSIQFEGWRYSIDDVKLMSDPTAPLLQWIHYAPIKTFLSCLDYFQMSENGFDMTWWTGKLCTNLSKTPQRCSAYALQNIQAISVTLVKCKRFVDSGTIANALDANKRMKPWLTFLCASAVGLDRNGPIGLRTLGYG